MIIRGAYRLAGPRALEGADDGLGRTASGADCPVHRAVSPFQIRRFAREPQCSLDRTRELRSGFRAANERVAVRAARESIVLPVVRPTSLDLRGDAGTRYTEMLRQRRHGAIPNLGWGPAREPPTGRPPRPSA